MEDIDQRIKNALDNQEWSYAIRLLEERQNVTRIIRQREICKSFSKNTSEERKENLGNILWLTVNPSSETPLQYFCKLVDKCFMKKWITKYIYVYEQRGTTEDEIGKGFHLHAIIYKPDNKPRAHCIRELANSFKKVCDVSNYHLFNTKWIGEEEYIRKVEYITGEKKSSEENNKSLKQDMDILFRQQNNLQPYYYLNIDIEQRSNNAIHQETQ